MILTRAEKAAVRAGTLPVAEARALVRRRVWTLLGGIGLGYGMLWIVNRLAQV